MSALEKQEGGAHYRAMTIQPVLHPREWAGFLEGNVVKFTSRATA